VKINNEIMTEQKKLVNPVVSWSLTISKVHKQGMESLELPTVDELYDILDPITDDFVFALEEGEKLGKEHIQCYIKTKKRLRTTKQLINLFLSSGLEEKNASQYQFSKAFSPEHLKIYAAKTGRDGNKIYRKMDYQSSVLLSEHTTDLLPNQVLIDDAVEKSFTQDRYITYVSDLGSGLDKTTMLKRYSLGMHAAGRVGFQAVLVPDSSIQATAYFIAKSIKDGIEINPNQKFLFVFNFTYSDSRYKNIVPWYGLMESVMDGLITSAFGGKCITAHAQKNSTQVLVLSNRIPQHALLGAERINFVNIVS
jgi:hypothetical protein